MAEAFACHRAVSLAVDEGFDIIMVVSDCLSLTQRLNSIELDRSLVSVVVQDIKHISSDLSNISFKHTSHHCNYRVLDHRHRE